MASSSSSNNGKSLNPSLSQEFEQMRMEYEKRVKQLESNVFECCRNLNKENKQRQKQKPKQKSFPRSEYHDQPANYIETDKYIKWQYNMNEFPVENIIIQMKNGRIHICAYFKDDSQSLEIKREFLIPDHVEKSKLSARLTSNGILTLSVPLKTVFADNP